MFSGTTMNRGYEYREVVQAMQLGQLYLDGRPLTRDLPAVAGSVLTWRRPPWREPVAPTSVAVLHRDRDLLAVAKPPGLPTLPGGGFLEHTLLTRVRTFDSRAVPLHRLGRWTSGIVLFARTRMARSAVAEAWRQGAVAKRYRALASGRPEQRSFVVDTPIGPVPHDRLGSVFAACADGRPARSRVTVLEPRHNGFLADVDIDSGRPHQIRIHLAAAGHPLEGDPLYPVGGRPEADCPGLPGDPGYQLHAARLDLRHPRTGRRLVLHCTPPTALR